MVNLSNSLTRSAFSYFGLQCIWTVSILFGGSHHSADAMSVVPALASPEPVEMPHRGVVELSEVAGVWSLRHTVTHEVVDIPADASRTAGGTWELRFTQQGRYAFIRHSSGVKRWVNEVFNISVWCEGADRVLHFRNPWRDNSKMRLENYRAALSWCVADWSPGDGVARTFIVERRNIADRGARTFWLLSDFVQLFKLTAVWDKRKWFMQNLSKRWRPWLGDNGLVLDSHFRHRDLSHEDSSSSTHDRLCVSTIAVLMLLAKVAVTVEDMADAADAEAFIMGVVQKCTSSNLMLTIVPDAGYEPDPGQHPRMVRACKILCEGGRVDTSAVLGAGWDEDSVKELARAFQRVPRPTVAQLLVSLLLRKKSRVCGGVFRQVAFSLAFHVEEQNKFEELSSERVLTLPASVPVPSSVLRTAMTTAVQDRVAANTFALVRSRSAAGLQTVDPFMADHLQAAKYWWNARRVFSASTSRIWSIVADASRIGSKKEKLIGAIMDCEANYCAWAPPQVPLCSYSRTCFP